MELITKNYEKIIKPKEKEYKNKIFNYIDETICIINTKKIVDIGLISNRLN